MIVISSGTTAQIGLATSFVRIVDHTQLDTHQVGYLWTSDQLVEEAATHTTHKQNKGRTPHALSGIRARDPNNQAAADLYLRPHGQGDRQGVY